MSSFQHISSIRTRRNTEVFSLFRRLISSSIHKPVVETRTNNVEHLSNNVDPKVTKLEQKVTASPPTPSLPENKKASGLDTGAFVRWPNVYVPETHYRRALKTTRSIKIDDSIKNNRAAERKYGAQMIDALMKGLTKPITEILKIHEKNFKNLHPFEVSLSFFLLL